jgi:hypothetical protein
MNWPGSQTGAKVRDGLFRNLGAPVIDQPMIASGAGLERDQALRISPAAWERTRRGSVGAGKRKDKRPRTQHRKS